METEKENKLSFLKVEFICEQDKLTATLHGESTFIDVYSNSENFLPSVHKFGMICYLNLQMFSQLLKLNTNTCRVNFSERNILQE